MMPAALLFAERTRTRYELVRLEAFSQWWQLPLLILACLVVLAFVVLMYRRDSVELRSGVGVLLAALRIAAFVGLLVSFLKLEKRTERELTQNSRVVLLVDTSQSMGRREGAASAAAGQTRAEHVLSGLIEGGLIDELRKVHDVEVVRFDRDASKLLLLEKHGGRAADTLSPSGQPTSDSGAALAAGNVAESPNKRQEWQDSLRSGLQAQGNESRLGQALQRAIDERRSAPPAGVLLLSDGAQNAGVDHAAAMKLAQEASVPVFTIGVGDSEAPANVRVSDFLVQSRAYPGDRFTVTGEVQAQGLAGRSVTVELYLRQAGAASGSAQRVATRTITLGNEKLLVKFEVPGRPAAERLLLELRVRPPEEDADPSDNAQEESLEIVDRQNRVLLLAGGPTREFQFLRNQLRRDKRASVVDVYLQIAQSGPVSQDANKVLADFPRTVAEISEYDCIVAFDPDWRQLDNEQVELLECWTAEMAGGLVLIAGPVYTGQWLGEERLGKVRGLYPVEFGRATLFDQGRFGSTEPWPIRFTRAGLEAEFLWLGDTAVAAQQAWSELSGVYGYFDVRGAKPGATVYAHFSDPETGIAGNFPVYMAGQFYGAGRVFYLGSGEMWRSRTINENCFDQFYTKLLRHVSQGRLLRGSRKDILLVEQDRYPVGATVSVRAQLSDAQHRPLTRGEVALDLVRPDGSVSSVRLVADTVRKGFYAGTFAVLQEGAYRLDLSPPGSQEKPLSQRIQVRAADLEAEHYLRNDALLKDIADKTGGRYYVGMRAAAGLEGAPPLAAQLRDRSASSFTASVADRDWERGWMAWLLAFICGCLCLEWLLRRLFRLA